MANNSKRTYRSAGRQAGASQTRARILQAGRYLFSRKGIDATTIAQIAERAGVSEATVYATVKSKAGLLHELLHGALFGTDFQQARTELGRETDPVRRIALTAQVARAIYEAESKELSLLMKASAYSPELRKTLQKFESLRREMQRERIDALYAAGRQKKGLDPETARTLLWMFTSREIYYKLVYESGWPPEKFQRWLGATLLECLTDSAASDRTEPPARV